MFKIYIMDTRNFNEKQSLDIIQDMIGKAKQEDSGGAGFYFILWGLIVMVFSILTYIAIKTKSNWQPMTYSIFAIGGIISYFRSRKDDKEEKVKSWYDTLYMFVWSGVGICLGLTWGFALPLGIENIIPVSLMLYGLASFITGGVTKYRPSLLGAIICFICVIFAFSLNFAYQNLLMAFAVLCVHVIPGIMMKQHYRKKNYA